VGVAVDRALLDQVPESAFPKTVVVAKGQIAPQLVDRDLEHESRRRIRGLRNQGKRYNEGEAHQCPAGHGWAKREADSESITSHTNLRGPIKGRDAPTRSKVQVRI
jgi:hypothetical protein